MALPVLNSKPSGAGFVNKVFSSYLRQPLNFLWLTAVLAISACSEQEAAAIPIEIETFTASPGTIESSGGAVTLNWSTTQEPTTTNIVSSFGDRVSGINGTQVVVTPSQSTTYTLTVRLDGYADQATAAVTVTNPTEPPSPYPPEYEGPDLRYWVNSDCGKVATTYATKDGGTAQKDFGNGYVYTAENVARGTFLYISAQNQCRSGDVTVRIYKRGEIAKETTSSGAYVIATASDTF